jgi:hypothetical protein
VTTLFRPRVLDASALVELFSGHPGLMSLLDDATAGHVFVLIPTLAIAEAQAVLGVAPSLWDHILRMPGVLAMNLTQHAAVEVGRLAAPRLRHHPVHTALIGPLMAAQVLHEAQAMNAVIVTRVPETYGGHEVVIDPV